MSNFAIPKIVFETVYSMLFNAMHMRYSSTSARQSQYGKCLIIVLVTFWYVLVTFTHAYFICHDFEFK